MERQVSSVLSSILAIISSWLVVATATLLPYGPRLPKSRNSFPLLLALLLILCVSTLVSSPWYRHIPVRQDSPRRLSWIRALVMMNITVLVHRQPPQQHMSPGPSALDLKHLTMPRCFLEIISPCLSLYSTCRLRNRTYFVCLSSSPFYTHCFQRWTLAASASMYKLCKRTVKS